MKISKVFLLFLFFKKIRKGKTSYNLRKSVCQDFSLQNWKVKGFDVIHVSDQQTRIDLSPIPSYFMLIILSKRSLHEGTLFETENVAILLSPSPMSRRDRSKDSFFPRFSAIFTGEQFCFFRAKFTLILFNFLSFLQHRQRQWPSGNRPCHRVTALMSAVLQLGFTHNHKSNSSEGHSKYNDRPNTISFLLQKLDYCVLSISFFVEMSAPLKSSWFLAW